MNSRWSGPLCGVIFLAAVIAMMAAVRAPVLGASGVDLLAAWYVCLATALGLVLSRAAARSGLAEPRLRGFAAAFGAMGLAGLATLAVLTVAIFPEGYRKSGGAIQASGLILAFTNLFAGTLAGRLLLRWPWGKAVVWAVAVLLAGPFLLIPVIGLLSVLGPVLRGR